MNKTTKDQEAWDDQTGEEVDWDGVTSDEDSTEEQDEVDGDIINQEDSDVIQSTPGDVDDAPTSEVGVQPNRGVLTPAESAATAAEGASIMGESSIDASPITPRSRGPRSHDQVNGATEIMGSSPAGGTDLSLTGGSLTTIQSETIASADSPEGPVGGEQSAAFARLRVVQEGGVMTVTTSDSPEATAGRDESDALARLLTMQAGGAMCTVYVT